MRKRLIALFTSVTLLMTMIIASSAVTVSAASKKYDVPSKIVVYYNASDDDEVEWAYDYKIPLKYDSKGNIKKIEKYNVKWEYKKGKPVKAVTGSKKQKVRSEAVYKNGKLQKETFKCYNKKGKVTQKSVATFAYKKGWISRRTEQSGKNKFTLYYSYEFYDNGLLKKMTNKSKASNGKTFKYYTYFNDKGLVTKYKSKFEKEKFKYKYDEEGRPVQCIIINDGRPLTKLVFKYSGDKTKNKKLYMGIMNYLSIMQAAQDVIPSAWGMFA